MNELDLIRSLLAEDPPSAEVVAEGRRRIAAGRVRRQPARTRWTLAGAGLTAAAALALTAALILPTRPGQQGRAARTPSFGSARTASGVLLNAALAALATPTGAPAPGQFVYTKVYVYQQRSGAAIEQLWSSVDGTRLGIEDNGPGQRAAIPACQDGFWLDKPVGMPAERSTTRCTATENAAYLPSLPTSTSALRRFLLRQFGLRPGDSGGLLSNVGWMTMTHYLTPAQRAALYRVLAGTPGLTVVPHVANVRGQAGIGVRSGEYKGSVYTIIFSSRTYRPLGMNWVGVAGPMKGTRNGEVLLKSAIANSTGPLP